MQTRAPAAPPVLVRGGGLAAACAAHLLRRAGHDVITRPQQRVPVPVIMLSDAALGMIRDVFGRPDLFAGHHRITRRVVRWGAGETVDMPHGAHVISEGDLLAAFGTALVGELAGEEQGARSAPAQLLATIHAAAPFPGDAMLRFGQRRAMAAPVALIPDADRTAVHVESVDRGWLFLIPSGPDAAWLLGVGGPVELLLEESRLIAPLVAAVGEATPGFETAPRQLPRLAGADWLACGMAAIAYDPICGDGTAQAVREAVLASAVLTAMAEGGDRAALGDHYHAMLTASLRRHIQLSAQFYATGGQGPWWQDQIAGLARGYDWTTAQLAHRPEPHYRLDGYRLIQREPAT